MILHFVSNFGPTFVIQTCSLNAFGIFCFMFISIYYLTAVYAFTRNGVVIPWTASTKDEKGM
jgi:hypothetical protein